jgi:hypothetical protein
MLSCVPLEISGRISKGMKRLKILIMRETKVSMPDFAFLSGDRDFSVA